MYASKKNRGFFSHLNYPGVDLSDAVQLSEDQYAALVNSGLPIDWSGPLPQPLDVSESTDQDTARIARRQRDALLRNVYDPAVAMLQRSARIDPDNAEQYTAKLAEFDAWAVALQAIPEQEGFPQNVVWPEQPSKEL